MSEFTPRQRVLFELDGELRQGWYAYQFGHNVSCVTLQAPEDWFTLPDGKTMPEVYTRRDSEIRPYIGGERHAEIKAALDEYDRQHAERVAAGGDDSGWLPYQDIILGLPEFDADDIRNREMPEHLDCYVLRDGSVIELENSTWRIRPPRPLSARLCPARVTRPGSNRPGSSRLRARPSGKWRRNWASQCGHSSHGASNGRRGGRGWTTDARRRGRCAAGVPAPGTLLSGGWPAYRRGSYRPILFAA